MDTLSGMRAFVAVVSAGSFTQGAERLGISKAVASKYVALLENRLSVRLLNRSTRSLHTTSVGRAYFERCQKILEEFEELERAVRDETKEPQGTLTVAAPQTFGTQFVSDAAATYVQRYPKVSVDIHLADRYVNLVEDGFDLGVRVGDLPDSNLAYRTLGTIELLACASPEYIARRGTPRKPSDLTLHDCVRDRNYRRGRRWQFSKNGESEEVDISFRLSVNGIAPAHRAILAGAGIGMLGKHIIAEDVNAGRLVTVLNDYQSLTLPINAVYPHRLHLTEKVKSFIDTLAETLQQAGLTNTVAAARKAKPTVRNSRYRSSE